MIRRMMFTSVIVSAIGLPYLLSTGSAWWSTIKSQFSSSAAADPSGAGTGALAATSVSTSRAAAPLGPEAPAFGSPAKALPIEGYGARDLNEVLNFGATPAWVMQRWPRVTVGLAEIDMQGYRVPLVTGTRPDDLAGVLTYYFDEKQQAKLIHFRGTTGDPRKLIQLVMSQYKFLPQASGDPSLQLYQVKWNGKPISELQVHTAHVMRASQPNSRYRVELALKRP